MPRGKKRWSIWPYLRDKDPAVARAAAVVLARYADDSLSKEAEDLLRKVALREDESVGDRSFFCLEALARMPYARTRDLFLTKLRRLRDDPFECPSMPGSDLIMTTTLAFVVDFVSKHDDAESRDAVLEFAQYRLKSFAEGAVPKWQNREYLGKALGRVRDERSIHMLIELLDPERFGCREPAEALSRLTGRDSGFGPDEWRQWAKDNKGHLLKPQESAPQKGAAASSR